MKDIIYISNPLFGDNRTSSHHIAWELTKKHRVLYIESGGMRKPELTHNDLHKICERFRNTFRRPEKINDRLYLYKMINVPFHGLKTVRAFNKFMTILVVRGLTHFLNFRNDILWVFAPDYGMLIGRLNERRSVYYCVDDYSLLPGVNRHAIEKMEKELLKKVDAAFFTSLELYRKKRHLTRNPHYSPHSVDYEHFSRAQTGLLSVPQDISDLKGPTILFIGLVEKWLDFDLIDFLAKKRRDWNFVFIGRIAVDIGSVCRPNVRFLGFRKYESLPHYLAHCDVCIIPFKRDKLSWYINPIKLKEYMASGKPVVSTYMPQLEEFKNALRLANSRDEFLQNIEFYLNNDTPKEREKRINCVREDSWENRVRDVLKKAMTC